MPLQDAKVLPQLEADRRRKKLGEPLNFIESKPPMLVTSKGTFIEIHGSWKSIFKFGQFRMPERISPRQYRFANGKIITAVNDKVYRLRDLHGYKKSVLSNDGFVIHYTVDSCYVEIKPGRLILVEFLSDVGGAKW